MSYNKFERTGRRPSMLSAWQRLIGGGSADGHDPRCRMIDADGIYWCLRCKPPVPLAIFEEFQDQNVDIDEKPVACTGRVIYPADNWIFGGFSHGIAKAHRDGLTDRMRDIAQGKKFTHPRATTTPKLLLYRWRDGFTQLVDVPYQSSWKASLPTATPAEKQRARELRDIKTAQVHVFRQVVGNSEIRLYDESGVLMRTIPLLLHETERRIKRALSPELLKREWREKATGQHSTFGHCYVACEALYHRGARHCGFKPFTIRPTEDGTHWFLKHSDGTIIDPTSEQFTTRGIRIPYEAGKSCGFLTKLPSKRCMELFRRMYEHNETTSVHQQ